MKDNKNNLPIKTDFFKPLAKKTTERPFDSARHERLMQTVQRKESLLLYSKENQKNYIQIDSRRSGAKGFGSASMREIVKASLSDPDCKGNVVNIASESSHLFHLKMGMMPSYESRLYLEEKYGALESIVNTFVSCRDLSKMKAVDQQFLKIVYRLEKAIPDDQNITNKDLLENLDFLATLITKKSSMSDFFIPMLIAKLKSNIGVERPNTESFGQIKMCLSPIAKERWRDAITRNIEFEPFRDFSHLLPYMTEQQKLELNDVLIQQAQALKKSSIESSCSP
ncbi:MAG: hypothetical protein JSR33_02240 [Proteobacteria bacterium]|nr:hypothetical protein [Pseudomonadota bacterium]